MTLPSSIPDSVRHPSTQLTEQPRDVASDTGTGNQVDPAGSCMRGTLLRKSGTLPRPADISRTFFARILDRSDFQPWIYDNVLQTCETFCVIYDV